MRHIGSTEEQLVGMFPSPTARGEENKGNNWHMKMT